MFHKFILGIGIAIGLGLASNGALARQPDFAPGAPGLGDPYYPLDGNGGYDVKHYLLQLRYDPSSDRLKGVATITAKATTDLSQFNLDLDGLNVTSVRVDGRVASWTREGAELTIKPKKGLRKNTRFEVEVRYKGVPETLPPIWRVWPSGSSR